MQVGGGGGVVNQITRHTCRFHRPAFRKSAFLCVLAPGRGSPQCPPRGQRQTLFDALFDKAGGGARKRSMSESPSEAIGEMDKYGIFSEGLGILLSSKLTRWKIVFTLH